MASDGQGDGGTGRGVLVIQRDPLVALDIAETLARDLPGIAVVLARSCDEALAQAEGRPPPAVALVAAAPEGFGASPLGRWLAGAGVRVILTGDAAEERGEAAGFAVLHRPFTSRALVDCLRAALAAPPQADNVSVEAKNIA
ncbi:MAG: hypothetical protein D6686_08300 [Alphaproteobacteria bacterium]|nr:MAG: hypothetical protein D6686_08300 [Alphaproteobacteria bacterium]